MRAAVLHVPQRERLVAPQESSPLKRKYNGDGETQVQLRLRLIKNINCIGLLNAKSGFLFPSGDVLLKSRPGVVLIRDVVNLAEQDDHSLISETDHGVESVPSMCALNNLEGGWRELVGASRDGRVFSAVIDDDGHTTTMLHEDLLGADKSPDDLVTAIYHAGMLLHVFY